MKGYGQFCPVAKAAEIVGERWSILVIRELAAGSDSFNDLKKGLPLLSPTLLSTRLKSLESAGVLKKVALSRGGSRYLLTKAGEELAKVIWQLGTWGHRWARSDLSEKDLDPSMLMWDVRRTLNKEYFDSKQRTVILVEFTDYTSRMRFWWLVIDRSEVDVCLKDPGYEVQLQITTDLRTLTAVWMGDSTMSREIRRRNIQLSGSGRLKEDIGTWLGANFYASVKPAR